MSDNSLVTNSMANPDTLTVGTDTYTFAPTKDMTDEELFGKDYLESLKALPDAHAVNYQEEYRKAKAKVEELEAELWSLNEEVSFTDDFWKKELKKAKKKQRAKRKQLRQCIRNFVDDIETRSDAKDILALLKHHAVIA